MISWFLLLSPLMLVGALPNLAGAQSGTTLRIVSGVTGTGHASEQWLAMIRKRLPPARYEAMAGLRIPLTEAESAWAALIRSRVAAWEETIPSLAALFEPVAPPGEVLIVLGNRGADDAFTHDAVTIGFDLSALQANYGDAVRTENAERVDRFFRHEFVHVMQKPWVKTHPWVTDTPLQAAIADIWSEGLGNYYSLSARWLGKNGRRSDAAQKTLSVLEPRFVARLSALACASRQNAEPLLADLSSGAFDQKWGALPAALWLEAEDGEPNVALRRFIVAGPAGVWDLADRHLPDALRLVLVEAQRADSTCARR